MYLRGVRLSAQSHSRCVIQSVASFLCHTALACAPVRELSLYPGTRQPVLRAGFALCPSHVPLTSGLWGSQLLKQCKAHYSHRSLQSAMVSQPSLGRYRPLLLALPLPPARWTQEDLWRRWMRRIISAYLWSHCSFTVAVDIKILTWVIDKCQAVFYFTFLLTAFSHSFIIIIHAVFMNS